MQFEIKKNIRPEEDAVLQWEAKVSANVSYCLIGVTMYSVSVNHCPSLLP